MSQKLSTRNDTLAVVIFSILSWYIFMYRVNAKTGAGLAAAVTVTSKKEVPSDKGKNKFQVYVLK